MSQIRLDIESLTVDERLDLLEQIWESLAAHPERVPLTDAQRAELDRRLDDLDREGPVGLSWNEMIAQFRNPEVAQ
jgi:putative addiction module component (TIGR02574 family)